MNRPWDPFQNRAAILPPLQDAVVADPILALIAKWEIAAAAHKAACDRYGEAQEPIFALRRAGLPTPQDLLDEESASEAASQQACYYEWDLTEEVIAASPAGIAGLLAKVRFIGHYLIGCHVIGDDDETVEDRMIRFLLRDADRFASGGAP